MSENKFKHAKESTTSILPLSPDILIEENKELILDRRKQLVEELNRLKKEEEENRLLTFKDELRKLSQKFGVRISPRITITGSEITSTLYLEIIESNEN